MSIDSTSTGPLGTTTVDGSDFEIMYGLGLAWKIGERFGLRLEYEEWDVEGQLQEYSIGAYYRFGKR